MSYLKTETRRGVRRRIYKADSLMDAVQFAFLFNGYHYEFTPDNYQVII